MKLIGSRAFRVAVSAGILLFLLLSIDLESLPRLSEISVAFAVALLIAVILDRLANVVRWFLLIRAQGGPAVRFRDVASIYIKSNFLGFAMPSSIGGELLKGYALFKTTSSGFGAVSSLIAERFLGLVSLASICLLGSFFPVDARAESAVMVARALSGGILLSVFPVVWLGSGRHRLGSRLRARMGVRASSWLDRLGSSLTVYRDEPRALAWALCWSYTIQFLRILATWLAAMAVGLSLGTQYYLVFVPFTALLTSLPISLGGLGVQEGAFVFFFTLAGAEPASAFAMAVVLRIPILLSVAPGGVLYFREGLGGRATATT
jgi:uncharacterized protein (TIRG00374 family)